MTHSLLCTLAALSLAALPLSAQQSGKDKNTQDRLGLDKVEQGESSKGSLPGHWSCIINDADEAVTIIRLSTITSISKQTYLLEGTQKIVEVTIDTTGNNSIRFYCLGSERVNRALGQARNARELFDKHTENAARFPAKKYPDATHSHNIEYQLSSPEQINRIYESVTHAWVKNVSANLRISL